GAAVIRQNLEEPHTVDLPASDTSVFITDMPVVREDSTGCEQTLQKEFRVAMLLPSYLANNSPASAPDSSMVKDSEGRYKYKDGRYWIHPHSANALEFYEGALLAVDSLKKLGLNVSIHLYDTMHDPEKMQQILNSPVMGTMDLLIGPFYTELINQTSLFAQQNRIYYVSPTSINAASLKNNPYLIQVNSGDINVVNPVVDYIAGQENIHVTLIGNRSESDQSLFQAYCNKLRTVIPDSSLNIHSFRIDSLLQPNRYLKKAKLNAVIIPSNNEAFVNILTTQLNNAAHSHNINLYGLTSWTKFVNIDSEYFHKLELRYAASFYVDYNRPDVQRFLQQFRKYYCTEPTMLTGRGSLSNHAFQYSFLGYDVMFYFASAMARYGKEFGYCIPRFHLPLLQSDFHFIKVDPFSGYINTHLDIFRYTKDYTIVKEDRQAMDD
ncbi:MAG: ABC transporter substrate-binding protein, partial [Prevotellaceae bacterium]|nr:ABC transporter substrate-binding protein [Prevotellaceae bacterium]